MSLWGTMKSWLAITRLPKISTNPVSPATPKPGIKNSSTTMNTIPATKKQNFQPPDVPPRKRLQKNKPKQRPDTRPPIPVPGTLSSAYKASHTNDDQQNRSPERNSESRLGCLPSSIPGLRCHQDPNHSVGPRLRGSTQIVLASWSSTARSPLTSKKSPFRDS